MTLHIIGFKHVQLFLFLSLPQAQISHRVLISLKRLIYAMVDTWNSAVDALAWLALLILYELEAMAQLR